MIPLVHNVARVSKSVAPKQQRWLDLLTTMIFLGFSALALRYQAKLLNYFEFGDESETIVAAKMIANGKSLYAEIFNHHGPLTFLSGLLLEKFGDFGVPVHRIPIAILQWVALAAIYSSPLLENRFLRQIYTMLAASVILLYLPEAFLLGHTYVYQVIAGLLLVVILSQYTLPVIACPDKITTGNIVVGNILVGSLPFLAITYIPVAALLFLASARKAFLSKSLTWLASGIVLNFVFLVCIGSIPGFVAFHIYLNAELLPHYNGEQRGFQLIQTAFNTATGDISQFVIFTLTAIAISRMGSNEGRTPWRSLSVGVGLGSLLMRGALFHEIPYFYSALAIPLVFFKNQSTTAVQSQVIALAFSLACLIKVSLIIPADIDKFKSNQIPESTEFSQLAQLFTTKQDRIIAYSFENFEYIAADRLPASGHFFYLPWQEKYNENPQLGIKIDACKEIAARRPKIMLIDKWKVWDKFPWESYATCIQGLIDKDYIQVSGRPYYIRKDILEDDMGLTSNDGPEKMQPSRELTSFSPINILMTSSHQNRTMALKKIGVLFDTYAKRGPGYAELRLEGPGGSEFSQAFDMTNVVDNKYYYFDLDSKQYTTGEIVSLSGSGISTWESHDAKGGIHTCLSYEYIDGRRRFTPGCPLF